MNGEFFYCRCSDPKSLTTFWEHLICLLQASRRPTLPRLKTKYHWRWGDLRPSSGWDRVWTPRQSHEAGERQKQRSTNLERVSSRRRISFSLLVALVLSVNTNNEN